jgi:hypothetical protein
VSRRIPQSGTAIIAYLAAIGAAAFVLAAQPLGDPWWVAADADGSYTGSALNIAAGGHTKYLDHPGLPLQVAGATGFVVWHAAELFPGTMRSFAGDMLGNLDRARPLYRGLAIAIYLLGVTVAFVVALRALGSAWWGLAGALMWMASPGLVPMATQFRPDVLLSWLVLLGTYLLVSGYERRDPLRLLAAATVAGFALTTKVQAVGLVPSLVLASVLGGPFPNWRERVLTWARTRRRAIAAVSVAWLTIAVYFDVSQLSRRPSAKGVALVLTAAAVAVAWASLGKLAPGGLHIRAVAALSAFNGALVGAFLIGVLIPVGLILTDGLQSLVWIANALLGRGINQGVTHLTNYGSLLQFPLLQALIVFGLGAVAAAAGAMRRDWAPALWFLASAVMGVLAVERLGATHYFAPAYVLAIVPALGLLRRMGRFVAPVAAAALVLGIAIPQIQHLSDYRIAADARTATVRSTQQALERAVTPGKVAFTVPNTLLPDSFYSALVAVYVEWMPPYPYRALPAAPVGEWTATELRLKPSLYLSDQPLPEGARTLTIGDFTVRPDHPQPIGSYLGYQIVSGAGLDRPTPATRPAGAPQISPP